MAINIERMRSSFEIEEITLQEIEQKNSKRHKIPIEIESISFEFEEMTCQCSRLSR